MSLRRLLWGRTRAESQALARAEAIERAKRHHWLVMNEGRAVVGCHCGFKASDDDEGYGDSVVAHLLGVVA